ncbi:PrgI family protein [Candidatus Roizmanbacteria bacterium]|nr:PrgI family protein [Candidatus Roizmanbacteria bacterium]
MEQHPVPRQITTFEFKLIGFMTLKQFMYLVVFVPLGYIVYRLTPIPILNVLLALIIAGFGFALAFIPFNDRPLDVLIKNLAKRLISPTQYFYKKQNSPVYFLQNLYFAKDPHLVFSHIESEKKLSRYLAEKGKISQEVKGDEKKKTISALFSLPKEEGKETRQAAPKTREVDDQTTHKTPYFTGVIKNNKKIPLPGVLIYVKDQSGNPVRLLKTNPHGVFATFSKLPPGDYTFEIKDPKGKFFFDTMKMKLNGESVKPLELYSKELL